MVPNTEDLAIYGATNTLAVIHILACLDKLTVDNPAARIELTRATIFSQAGLELLRLATGTEEETPNIEAAEALIGHPLRNLVPKQKG